MSAPKATPFAGMSMTGLSVAFAAALAAQEALAGIYNQPRTDTDPLAHAWVDAEIDRTTALAQTIAHEAAGRNPTRRDDVRARAEILIRWGLECGSWPDILNAVHIEPRREEAA